MKCSEFLKSVGFGASGFVLRLGLLKDKPIKIYDNYLKGIQYYQASILEGFKNLQGLASHYYRT